MSAVIVARQEQIAPGERIRTLISWTVATLLVGALGLGMLSLGAGAQVAPPADPPPRPVILAAELLPPPEPQSEPEPPTAAPEPPPAPPPVSAPAHLPRKKPAPAAPPPKPLEAPEEIPTKAPKEANAEDFAVAAAPPGEGDPAGRAGGTGEVGALASLEPGTDETARPRHSPRRPVRLPPDARPPRMLPESGAPDFPPEMRSAGKEGLVVLQVVIREDGRITRWRVLQGEEPFVAAAIEWVKRTRWEPAIGADGERLAVFQILRIPFRLRM